MTLKYNLGYTGNMLDRADHLRRDSAAIQAARMHPAPAS
jgi:hypothetical protein